MSKHKLSEKQQVWLSHLQSCIAQKVSMKAYAVEHGLKLQTLYYWKKQFKKLGLVDVNSSSRFVKAVCRKETKATGIHIRFANGVTIDVACDIAPSVLTDLIVAARRL